MTRRRVQLDLSDKSYSRLKTLSDKVEATSMSEVMKDAIRLYEYVVEKTESGAKFYCKDENNELIEIKIF